MNFFCCKGTCSGRVVDKKHLGYCPSCYSLLSSETIRKLKGTPEEPKLVVNRIYPEPPRLIKVLVFIWRLVVSTALVWLIYRSTK